LEKLYPKIKSQLKLEALTELKRTSSVIALRADKTEVDDILTAQQNSGKWLLENRNGNLFSLPIAIDERGETYCLPLHHSLISGLTGSGKSAPLTSIITQLLPFWETGLVKFYGIDPKNSDLKAFGATTIFDDFTSDENQAIELIHKVYEILQERIKKSRIDREAKDLNRSLKPSKANPVIMLMIDELLALLLTFKQIGNAGKKPFMELNAILAKGRSIGVYVVAATQGNDKDLFGQMRGNFGNVIVLRQDSRYFNDLFLGESAVERGFDATAIPLSNAANGYKYAGIGFVKQEAGEPLRVRFPHNTDADIFALTEPYWREQPMSLDNLLNDDSDLFTLI